MNTWDTGVGLVKIPAMPDTVIETTEITKTLIAIARRVVGTRGTVTATEGTAGIGETAGARPQPAGVSEDTRLSIGVEEVTQGAHQGEEALAATGSQTVRVALASRQQTVQTRVGEVGAIAKDETVIGSASSSSKPHFMCNTNRNTCSTTRPTIVPPCQVCLCFL